MESGDAGGGGGSRGLIFKFITVNKTNEMCSVLNATPLETGSYVRFSSELQDQKCHKSVLMNTCRKTSHSPACSSKLSETNAETISSVTSVKDTL